MSAGTRSRAITAQASASSAIFASSGVTTSMITPPFNISASPVFSRNVARSVISAILRGQAVRPAPDCGAAAPPAGGADLGGPPREGWWAQNRRQDPPAGAPSSLLLQFVGADAVFVRGFIPGVQPVRETLYQRHQRRVGAREAGAV